MDFPARLPDRLRRGLPPGVSLFPRPRKRRWIMSCAPDWRQVTLPAEVVTCDDALAHVHRHLEAAGADPGEAMRRRREEGPEVALCADRWLALLEKDPRCAPATLKGHRTHVERWIKPAFGTLSMARLDVPGVRAWLRALRAASKDPRSTLHAVSSFRTLYGVAMAEGWIDVPANLFRHDGVLAELPEVEDADPIRLPPPVVQKLLDSPAVSLERRARYALAFCTGARDGELQGLRLDRMGREGAVRFVKIEDAVALVGKKGPGGFAKVKGPKTRSSRRTIPLHACAEAAIAEWLAVGWPQLVGRAPCPADFLFPRPDGKPSRPRSAEQIREDLRAAGLPDTVDALPVEFKASRSSFLTWLDEMGVDERVRKRLAGHRALDVTERHYTVRELEQLAAAVATIPLRWTAGLGTVTPAVSAGTVNADCPMMSAPPRRLERPTNGLGKGRRRGTGHAQPPANPASGYVLSLESSGHAEDVGRASTPAAVPAGEQLELDFTAPPPAAARPGLARARQPSPPVELEEGEQLVAGVQLR